MPDASEDELLSGYHNPRVNVEYCLACITWLERFGRYPTLGHYLSSLPEPERTAEYARIQAKYAADYDEGTD